MDPRHPEQAISRMRELMKQYDRIESDMNAATTSAKLAQLEREGGLVIQEICLVAPRIHEAMIQKSRFIRHELSRAVYMPTTAEEFFGGESLIEKIAEKHEDSQQDETVVVEPKHRKKKTAKKKTTKKTKKADK